MAPLSTMNAPAVLYRLKDVRVEQPAGTTLQVSCLELPEGSLAAVVGPNGAGKTTLLRVLAFLVRPDAGTVELAGRAAPMLEVGLTEFRRRVTLVAQSPFLFHRSVGENVAYGLRKRGAAVRAAAIDEALGAVGLAGFAPRQAWKLSGGESQRVAIARALALDAEIYLFDEPTANVDRRHTDLVEELIRRLAARGKTVVFATHDAAQAARLGASVFRLEHGRVVGAEPGAAACAAHRGSTA